MLWKRLGFSLTISLILLHSIFRLSLSIRRLKKPLSRVLWKEELKTRNHGATFVTISNYWIHNFIMKWMNFLACLFQLKINVILDLISQSQSHCQTIAIKKPEQFQFVFWRLTLLHSSLNFINYIIIRFDNSNIHKRSMVNVHERHTTFYHKNFQTFSL